jgi:transposase-like protein
MAKKYPREFRDDIVRVDTRHEAPITQMAEDLGISDATLFEWIKKPTSTTAWHESHVTNGPTEAANNLIKRVKRAAFGFRSIRHYRIRALLYAAP